MGEAVMSFRTSAQNGIQLLPGMMPGRLKKCEYPTAHPFPSPLMAFSASISRTSAKISSASIRLAQTVKP